MFNSTGAKYGRYPESYEGFIDLFESLLDDLEEDLQKRAEESRGGKWRKRR